LSELADAANYQDTVGPAIPERKLVLAEVERTKKVLEHGWLRSDSRFMAGLVVGAIVGFVVARLIS
jgi:hypothetical protein